MVITISERDSEVNNLTLINGEMLLTPVSNGILNSSSTIFLQRSSCVRGITSTGIRPSRPQNK